jgi:hypothetical protein
MKLTIAIYGVLIFVVILIWLIIIGEFDPFILSDLNPYNATLPNVTIGEPAAACDVTYQDFSLLQLAGLSAMAMNPNDEVASETIKYIFPDDSPTWNASNGSVSALMIVNTSHGTVGVFRPILDRTDVGFLLENLLNQYFPDAMGAIIPLFRIMNGLFLDRFLGMLSENVATSLGIRQLSTDYASFASTAHNSTQDFGNNTILFTGHGVGGMLTKGVGTSFHENAVSFEGLPYHRSVFASAMTISRGLAGEHPFPDNSYQIVGVWSPQSFLSFEDSNLSVTVQLPNKKNYLRPLSPYDTVCMIAAGCVTDARFDGYCDSAIGHDSYLTMFRYWNRSRIDGTADPN